MASVQPDAKLTPKLEPESEADAILRERIISVLNSESPLRSTPLTAHTLIGSWPIPSAEFLSRVVGDMSLLQYVVEQRQGTLLNIWLERFPELVERLVELKILAAAMFMLAVDALRVIHVAKPLQAKQMLSFIPSLTDFRKESFFRLVRCDEDFLRVLQFLFQDLKCTVADFAAESANKEMSNPSHKTLVPDATLPVSMAYLEQVLLAAPQQDLERAIPHFRQILQLRGWSKCGYDTLPSWFKALMAAHPQIKVKST